MNLVSANGLAPCPRCNTEYYRGIPCHGCFLCDDRRHVSPALAAAYILIANPTLPKPNGHEVQKLRRDLDE